MNPLNQLFASLSTAKALLLAALALILLGNTIALARVAWNRSGEPEVRTFTERELSYPRRYRNDTENSGLTLRLDWQGTPPETIEGTAFWAKRRNIKADKATLESLGFPTEYNCGTEHDRRRDPLSQKAWIALEYNGPTHRHYIRTLKNHYAERQAEFSDDLTEKRRRELESMRDRISDVKTEDSRLYAVDVAPERTTLEQRYAGSEIHLIQPATVMPWLHCGKPVDVYVADLLTDNVYVPKRHRQGFDDYENRRRTGGGLRYEVKVAYGKLAEPWMVGVTTQQNR